MEPRRPVARQARLRSTHRRRVLTSIALALSLGACSDAWVRRATPGPNPTEVEIEAAAAFAADPESVWWRRAVADTLWRPMEASLTQNPALHEAAAAVQAALARQRQALAEIGAEVGLSADAGVQWTEGDRSDSSSLGVAGRLPIDLSGALHHRALAAALDVRTTRAETQQLTADIVRDYLVAVTDRAEAIGLHALLLQQIELAETLQRLIEVRFTQGLASSVDVLQQRDQVAALRQQLPLASLAEQRAANRLRSLCALTPDQAVPVTTDLLPDVSDRFPEVEATALLDRRALLRADRARLTAADARFAAALADRWPSVEISGLALSRTLSGDFSHLISATLEAAFTLFDGGRKAALADERRALLVAAGQRLLADWLDVLVEVDDLQREEAALRERIVLSDLRLENAQALLRATQRRYEQGVSDYLPVLEALRGLQQQERDRLTLQADLARGRMRLHRALGSPAAGDGR